MPVSQWISMSAATPALLARSCARYSDARPRRQPCSIRSKQKGSLGLHPPHLAAVRQPLPAIGSGQLSRGSAVCRNSATDGLSETLESTSISEWLATATGYFVLAGACVRSIPQIIRIQRSRSAEGISEAANLAELIAYSIMIAYNFRLGYAFNTFGEVVACWFQDIVLAFLIVKYNRRISKRFFVYALLFAVAFSATMTDIVSLRVLTWLQASTIFIISLGGRVPQIVMNVRNGGSGQLSMVTCGMNVAGCFARMFTTLVLTQDILNFVGTAVQAVLNGVLLIQCIRTAQRRQPPPTSTQTQAAFET